MTPPKPRILGVIPARLASTRLPRKVLREIACRPMLAWVYEAARACPQLDGVLIATDSDEVADLCTRNAWPVILTAPDLQSGSDRVHAVAQSHAAEIYVNIQGDEPLLRPEHLTALLRPFTGRRSPGHHPQSPMHPGEHRQPKRRQSRHRTGWSCPLLLPLGHPL